MTQQAKTETPSSMAEALSPEDRQRLNDALAAALSSVTKQGPQELARFVDLYAIEATRYATAAAAGDVTAKRMLMHIQAQMITDAARYGVQLFQKQEEAFRVALDVGLNTALRFLIAAA